MKACAAALAPLAMAMAIATATCTRTWAQPAASPVAPAAPMASKASTPGTAAPAPLVKPGLWETTTVIEDTSSTTRRSIVGRTCVQAVDAAQVERILPVQREPGMQCRNADVRRDATAWTWTVSCRSAEATRIGSGKMVFSGESYLGRVGIELRRKGAKPVKVEQTFSGKWLQACA